MNATRRAPAAVSPAHELRDLLFPLANALELIRMAAGDNPDVAAGVRLANRQLDEMRRFADELRDDTPPT